MDIKVLENPAELGSEAAYFAATKINEAITEKGKARIILSTGASQFDTIKELVKQNVDWSKVEMFHLDEYVDLAEDHPASFRKYLKERFVNHINIKNAFFVSGEGNVKENIKRLIEEIKKEPIDVALIGIGENGHIAFNDPPADFDTKESYIIVNLDEACKRQQVGEGWFETIEEVPDSAISMSVRQIVLSKTIISCVPYKVKAKAVKQVIYSGITNEIPATILKIHPDYTLFLDRDSASLLKFGDLL